MRSRRIIGVLWMIFSVGYLFQGFNNIYQYSTPNIFWLFMVPVAISHTQVIIGVLSAVVGIEILKNNDTRPLILSMSLILMVYITGDLINFGRGMISISGENILTLLLAILTFWLYNGDIQAESLKKMWIEKKSTSIGIVLIGLFPYIIQSWLSYGFYKFLH